MKSKRAIHVNVRKFKTFRIEGTEVLKRNLIRNEAIIRLRTISWQILTFHQ